MKLRRRPASPEQRPSLVTSPTATPTSAALNRRRFLQQSSLALGGTAVATLPPTAWIRKSNAAPDISPREEEPTQIRRTVCTYCSVGCGIVAEVQNGLWTGQEPDFFSPINLGAHCAKGAASREIAHGERRLKYPMKLINGRWKRIDWDTALDEISAKLLTIREAHGPDALFFCGSSKASNEVAYLQRKFAALWGSNNVDHQARICHSTTVAGVANTFGYGAMTNPYNDMHNCRAMLFIGSNAAEAHPVAMQHVLRGKENGARMIVVDPRFTRTAAHAHQFTRIRPGTDIPFMWGLLWHIFENSWEDQEFIDQRVYAMDDVREQVAQWPPTEVERVTGIPADEVHAIARTMAEHRPGSIVWCMGGTQHHIGSSNTRAYCILQLALGNIGVSGGGANIFRGHDNVQGATDIGPNSHTLPGYYGLSEEAWQHWCQVWDLDYDWLKTRFDFSQRYPNRDGGEQYPMYMEGIPVSRWFDGVLAKPDAIYQGTPIQAAIFMGHATNSQTRNVDLKRALEALELLVVIDPVPTVTAVLGNRENGAYLLPAGTQNEMRGSVTSSTRSVQWREQVIAPLFEAQADHVILHALATRLGFADAMFKHIAVEDGEPVVEDVLREINRGAWTIGYTGQSPERLKAHARHREDFDTTTLQATRGPLKGEYYGLPWPCWGTPEMGHPGTPILYDMSKPVAEGGLPFRARWGSEYEGDNLLADGISMPSAELDDGYPEFSSELLKRLGWWADLSATEQAAAEGRNWKTDLSGGIQRVAIAHGCAPFGNGKARCRVWNFPDPVPIHREPLYTPRRDLVARYPTYEDMKVFWRLPTLYRSIQERDVATQFPLIFTSGRLVEYEGGGDETRANKWLAELQRHMFVEIHPKDAVTIGLDPEGWVWLEGPEGGKILIRPMVTERVPPGIVFTPFHFGGWFQGQDLSHRYPEGAAPYISGEACNTATTYGYDIITQMQESKVTLCRIVAASR